MSKNRKWYDREFKLQVVERSYSVKDMSELGAELAISALLGQSHLSTGIQEQAKRNLNHVLRNFDEKHDQSLSLETPFCFYHGF